MKSENNPERKKRWWNQPEREEKRKWKLQTNKHWNEAISKKLTLRLLYFTKETRGMALFAYSINISATNTIKQKRDIECNQTIIF